MTCEAELLRRDPSEVELRLLIRLVALMAFPTGIVAALVSLL
ncbi:hypothetical protein [Methylocaldum sp. GT1BB]|jgi:hypothetical protein